jgi:hypothetical protein
MLTGGCLCGGVRYELGEPLGPASYCHCTRCQRRTGTAASASVRTAAGALRVVAGEGLLRSWQPEDGNPKVFCSVCGSHLWAEDRSSPGVYFVRLGSFDTDPGVRPSFHQFVDYAASWEPIPDDGLPRYGERRPAAAAPP